MTSQEAPIDVIAERNKANIRAMTSEIKETMTMEELNAIAQKYGFTFEHLFRGETFKRKGNIADKWEIWFHSPSGVDYDHENDRPRTFNDGKVGIGGTKEEAIADAVAYFVKYSS